MVVACRSPELISPERWDGRPVKEIPRRVQVRNARDRSGLPRIAIAVRHLVSVVVGAPAPMQGSGIGFAIADTAVQSSGAAIDRTANVELTCGGPDTLTGTCS